jgi:predicted ester cyclase
MAMTMAGRLVSAGVETAARNKLLVERMHAELLQSRDPSLVDRYFAPGFASHNMPPGFPAGVEGVRRFMAMFADSLDELSVTIDAVVAEGDLVAVRTTTRGLHTGSLLGIPATGRRLAIDGTDIVRVEGERIVEHWGLTNTVGALEQVGRLARIRWVLRQAISARRSDSKPG